MTSWTIWTWENRKKIDLRSLIFLMSYNIQYNGMYGKVLFCILDVDLTNVFHDNHERIDIFHHICINQFHDMNDIIQFYNVVMVFYYYYLSYLSLPSVVNWYLKQDHQQLSNNLLLMKYSIIKENNFSIFIFFETYR
jgi:hypothetical protein